jgi:hypothetical protein
VIDAVNAEDFSRLTHTGMFSVQLQPAGTITEGKGSVVQGVPAAKQQKQLPAKTSVEQNSRLLAEAIMRAKGDRDAA